MRWLEDMKAERGKKAFLAQSLDEIGLQACSKEAGKGRKGKDARKASRTAAEGSPDRRATAMQAHPNRKRRRVDTSAERTVQEQVNPSTSKLLTCNMCGALACEGIRGD